MSRPRPCGTDVGPAPAPAPRDDGGRDRDDDEEEEEEEDADEDAGAGSAGGSDGKWRVFSLGGALDYGDECTPPEDAATAGGAKLWVLEGKPIAAKKRL